ncbi:MAG: division/cell wall cluster transcriptional repressor MraZ [Oscillospiraceae bacterium]
MRTWRTAPDAQGRILIPNHLRQRAKLEKEVVVAGIFNRVEIWNAQRWAELEEEAFSSGSLEQAMEEMGCKRWHLTAMPRPIRPTATSRCRWTSV